MADEGDGDILERVRAACAAVARDAARVRIDAARLGDYAAEMALLLDTLPAATFDPRYHFRGDPADTAAYVLTLDAINFGSGYFPLCWPFRLSESNAWPSCASPAGKSRRID